MIAKKHTMHTDSKSSPTGLVRYLLQEKGRNVENCDFWITNCEENEMPIYAGEEIKDTQERNTRAKSDKTYHISVSFPAGERPSLEALKEMSETFQKNLGFEGHQSITVVHDDTDNYHFHMVINKVHPEKLTCITPKKDYEILAKTCAMLEKKYNLEKTNHVAKEKISAAKARDMEKANAIESLLGNIKREHFDIIDKAQSWEELHRNLAAVGISAQKRNNGLVFVSGTKGVKGSSVDRAFSMPNMEKRLGKYEQNEKIVVDATKAYKPRPMYASSELWEDYKMYKEGVKRQVQDVKDQTRLGIADIRAKTLLETMALKTKGNRLSKMLVVARIRQRAQVKIQKMRDIRAEKIQKIGKAKSWLDWNAEKAGQGSKDSMDYLRNRQKREGQKTNYEQRERGWSFIMGSNPKEAIAKGLVTKKGNIKVSRNLVEAKDSINIMEEARGGFSEKEMQVAVEIASKKFSGKIVLRGDNKFKKEFICTAIKSGIALEYRDTGLQSLHDFHYGKITQSLERAKLEKEKLDYSNARVYIEKRNQTRKKVCDIKEHLSLEKMGEGSGICQGMRTQGDTRLALIEKDGKIFVGVTDKVHKVGDILKVENGKIVKKKQIEKEKTKEVER